MPRRKPVGPQRDPAAVQAEIEQVQQRLAASIDELVERTHPKNVAKRGLAKVRHAGSQLVEEARAIASGNPARRKSSRFVEPPEGSILVSGEDEVVTEYGCGSRLLPRSWSGSVSVWWSRWVCWSCCAGEASVEW